MVLKSESSLQSIDQILTPEAIEQTIITANRERHMALSAISACGELDDMQAAKAIFNWEYFVERFPEHVKKYLDDEHRYYTEDLPYLD